MKLHNAFFVSLHNAIKALWNESNVPSDYENLTPTTTLKRIIIEKSKDGWVIKIVRR